MKILLVAVNAKYIHSNLAVYSLKAYAKEYRENISIAEYTINNLPEEILKGIYKEQADVIAFSCYIWNITLVTLLVTEIRKLQPEVKIWFGGPEVSYDPKECLKKVPALDGIVIGEGERTFYELTKFYVDGSGELSLIKGLAYKNSGTTHNNKDTMEITLAPGRELLDLDEIPFPYGDMEMFRNKIVYYESSRGCPYSCSYCLSSVERGVRFRSIGLIKQELQIFLDNKVAQVKFVDRTFNCKKSHAMEIWQYIRENDNGITNFHFEVMADLFQDKELDFLALLRPGQVQLEIGVQTTNADTVKAIHRSMDFKRLSDNVIRIGKGHNIHQHLDLIAGLPSEDFAAFSDSFNQVYRLKPDQLQIGFLKVLKGSPMEEESRACGIVHQDAPPYEILYTAQLSYPELLKLKGVCMMVETYYNSGQFDYSIWYLEHFFDTPMQLYLDLYDYFEENGLDLIPHSKIRKYEILLDFYMVKVIKLKMEASENLVSLFGEILYLDLCFQEVVKNRPVFAPEPVAPEKLHKIRRSLNLPRNQAAIEHFTYDVQTSALTGSSTPMERLLLFDYTCRDPINNHAKVTVVEII